jgi:hypothetical protein
MRRLSIAIPVVVLLLLAASNASAQANNYPAIDSKAVSTVQVTAPTPTFHIYEYQAELVSGAYALSNGWRMKVTPSRDGVVAQIDKQTPMRLVALTPDKFVSRDGNVSMTFNRGPDQDQMLMSYVPQSSSGLASEAVVVTATLAQR